MEILLVEDNPCDLELMQRALGRLSDAVAVARDGAQALEMLAAPAEGGRRPRVILLDLKLPKVCGFEVLRRIKADAELALVPVVMLSSSREERDIAECYRLGAASYVVKPLDYDGFCKTVSELSRYWLSINEPAR